MTQVKEHLITQKEICDKRTLKSIYFNKHNKSAWNRKRNAGYRNGLFYSNKMQRGIPFKSAYEYKFYKILEADKNVECYIAEPFSVPYVSSLGKKRIYIPDVIVLYTDATIDIFEIKPKEMLANADVQNKANAAKIWLRNNVKDYKVTFKFVTEDQLFTSSVEYQQTLKEVDVLRERLKT